MKTTPRILDWAPLAAIVLWAGCSHALADADNRQPTAGATSYSEPTDWPRLAHGYRPVLGLRLPETENAALGNASGTARLLARYARTSDVAEPIVYSVERAPWGLGLRGAERTTGFVLRATEGWSSAFEVNTSIDAVTAARRTMLSGQLYAPLVGAAGLAVGLSYSTWQSPTPAGGDTPFNGYALLPGKADPSNQQLGYQLQLNYLYGERNLVALTYGSRRDWEQYRLAPDPLASDPRQLSLTGEHWFSPSWAVRYEIPTPESGNLKRQGLRLGLQYRF